MENIRKPIRNTIKKSFELTRGEDVLVITDESKLPISKVFINEMNSIGADVDTYLIPKEIRPIQKTTPYFDSGIETLDLIIYLLENKPEEKPFRGRVVKLGRKYARVCMMPGVTEEMIESTLHVDYDELRKFTSKLTRKMNEKEKIKVTDEKGTDVEFSVKGRKFHQETGKITRRGSYGNLPSGETFTAPVENSFTGEIYFDHLSDFRTGKGHFKFEKGEVVEYDGVPEELEEIMEDQNNRTIGEFGIGTNPEARPDRGFLESEKALRTVHFAIGDSYDIGKNSSSYHYDFLIEEPTLEADGEVIMERGKFRM